MSHKFAFSALSLVLAASSVHADTLTIVSLDPTNYNGIGNETNRGGGFQVRANTGGYIGQTGAQTFTGTGAVGAINSANSFITFCLERTEFLASGNGPYGVQISTAGPAGQAPRVYGGAGGASGGYDSLSEATALLYSTFRRGGNIGTGGGVRVDTDAETSALQLAIWFLEGEVPFATIGASNYGVDAAMRTQAQDFVTWATQTAVSGQFYGVAVLNLTNSNGSPAQSLLTIVPLPPAAFAGLGTLAGVIGLGYIRRRRLANA